MQKKKGISLVTLVITIIVMTIIAGAIIFTLSDTNIFNKANEAVAKTNLNQVQNAANLIWMDAYLDANIKKEDITASYIKEELERQGIKTEDYDIIVKNAGVIVKEKYKGPTLGSLITSAEMYGTKVNYEANGITDWRVFYKQTVDGEEYVYLIASEKLAYSAYYDEDGKLTELGTKLTNSGATIAEATVGTKTVGQIYWATDSKVPTNAATIQNPALWMANWGKYGSYGTNINGRCVSYFLDENIWKDFANTKDYLDVNGNSYILGAIGTPTAEMFVASWNAIREATNNTSKYNKKLKLEPKGTTGYYVNDITNGETTSNTTSQSISTSDSLYIWSTAANSSVWLASPSGYDANNWLGVYYDGGVYDGHYSISKHYGVRPVVCLRADMPAKLVDSNIEI